MRPKLCGALFLFCLVVSSALAGEDEIRKTFATFQKAIKTKDGEKIWTLIDPDSQADANRAAKAVQTAFTKLGDKDKAEFEKKYGLTAKELGAMTGKLFLKSTRFYTKYHEVPDSKFLEAKVKGDSAVLRYMEEDGDKEKFSMVKYKGEWKFTVPMPKAVD